MTAPVVVAGGGVTGLTAAHRLRSLDPGRPVVLVEPSDRLGGMIRTTPFGGRLVDEGADAFLARVPWAVDLCVELGLGGRLIAPATDSAVIVARGRVRNMPAGLVLGVPTSLRAVAESGVVSPPGVARAALDLMKGDDWPGTDESIGSFMRRRLGDEVHEYLVDPLLGSINAGDTDRLSIEATAPQLAEVARRHRSIIGGLREQRRLHPPSPDEPVFNSLPGGVGELTAALAGRLAADDGVEIRRRAALATIEPAAAGPVAVLADGDRLATAGIVLAVPAPAAAEIVAGAVPAAHAYLARIEAASVAIVTMALRREEVAHPLDSSGMLVPRPEGRLMTACSFASSKWPHWADEGRVVLRASAGRHHDERPMMLDDDELVEALLSEVVELLGVSGDVLEWRVSRWPTSFPQYTPGHLRRLALAEEELASRLPGVELAGMSYRGIGIPACIRQAGEAAARLLARAAA